MEEEMREEGEGREERRRREERERKKKRRRKKSRSGHNEISASIMSAPAGSKAEGHQADCSWHQLM